MARIVLAAPDAFGRPDSWRAAGRALLFYGAAAGSGALAGLVSASSRLTLIGVFVGLVVAMAIAFSRQALLWFVLAGGLVLAGVFELYVPELRHFKYLLPVAAAMLLLHGVMDVLRDPARMRGRRTRAGIVFWMYVFIAVAAASTLLNSSIGLAVQGFKDYFVVWVFFFAIILAFHDDDLAMKRLPALFLLIALIQLPFVAHQYLVLVPLREGLGDYSVIAVDIIVGTFGGQMFGGGANAVLTLFMFIVVACLLGMWRHGALSAGKTAVLVPLLLVPVFINEAKVSVIYLPLVIAILFFRDLVQKPLRFFAIGAAGACLFALLMTAMVMFHPSGELRTWTDLVDLTLAQQTTTITEAERRGEYSSLTRLTALTFWAEENISSHPVHLAIGHGPSASRVLGDEDGVTLARTLADTRYGGMRLGYTALSALLWDTGLIGTGAVLALFFSAYRLAGRLARHCAPRDPVRAGIFDGLRAGIGIVVISLAHKDFFVYYIPYQILILTILAWLVVSARRLAPEPGASAR